MEPVFDAVRGLLYGPMHLGVRWSIEGLEHIPDSGPVILASNHTSYLDPLALGYFATKRHRRTRFLAKQELFEKRGLGFVFRGAHQIPVRRGTDGAAGSLVDAEDALRAGKCVTVFPEGTISLDLEPMVGKTGTARLAAATGAPVVPVGMWGLHRVMFKGRKPRWRAGVSEVVRIGEPLTIAADEDMLEATDRIMAAICAQVARARAAYPQSPAPGEDDWWVRPPETAVLRSCR
ncbi:MAG: lysophospholipid acyltransferase family protein [Acidimicrobiia bacterium]